MTRLEMESRTKRLALRVIQLCRVLRTKHRDAWPLADQRIRSETSVSAYDRAAGRARSKVEFLAKMGIVEHEADETCYWLEWIIESGILKDRLVRPLLDGADEITAMIVASRRTAKGAR